MQVCYQIMLGNGILANCGLLAYWSMSHILRLTLASRATKARAGGYQI